jgi:hypothetical protein
MKYQYQGLKPLAQSYCPVGAETKRSCVFFSQAEATLAGPSQNDRACGNTNGDSPCDQSPGNVCREAHGLTERSIISAKLTLSGFQSETVAGRSVGLQRLVRR